MTRRAIPSLPEAEEVYCPPGTFFMGSLDNSSDEYLSDLRKQLLKLERKVTLRRGFFMMETMVTRQMWRTLMGGNSSPFVTSPPPSDARFPLHHVSWCDAVAFCNALSQAEGLEEAYLLSHVYEKPGDFGFFCKATWKGWDCSGYRLPTEAEWEYVCRVGSGLAAWESPRPELISPCSSECPVGQTQPNSWGVFDLMGLIFEWCYDGWEPQLPAAEVTDPLMYGHPHYDGEKVVKGIVKDGGYVELCRSSNYFSSRFEWIGFRCVRTAT